MTCEHCEALAGVYDMRCSGCRARYLLALPPGKSWLDTRRWWLDKWRQEYGQAAADETQAAVTETYADRREAFKAMWMSQKGQ